MPLDEELTDAAGSFEYDDGDDDAEIVTVTMEVAGAPAKVVFKEVDVDAVGRVMRQGSKERSPLASDLLQTMEGIRRSVTSIDGKAVEFGKIGSWPLSVRDTYALGRIWRDIHVGGGEEGEVRAVSSKA
jgi:hypothetical protein